MVTTSDDGLAARLRTLRNQGMRAKYSTRASAATGE